MIKSTARGPAVCESVHYRFYIFYLSIAQAMNRLIVVFVSQEEWSTATAVIDSDYKAANLISISLVESSNFLRRSKFSVNCGHRKENELYLQFHVYKKYSALSVPSSHGIPPLGPKTTTKTSLLVEDLSVSGKALEMDQN